MSDETRDPDGPGGSGEPESVWHSVGQHAGWGLTIAVSIGLFLWLGYLADRRLGTLPVLTIVGAFVGAGGGFYSMFRQLVTEPGRSEGPGTRSDERGAPDDEDDEGPGEIR